ncbi:MAG TPA: hypothetical protein VKH19_08760 [Gemmatimonadaceae bacterium]|nr:hypothetical protein [Gemmatimonadaceae bacterium]
MNIARLNTACRTQPASRKILVASLAVAAITLAASRVTAQATPADSLADRLRRAEAAIRSLQQQVADQAESSARTRSGMHLELSGRVMVAGFGNSRRVNNVDNPQFVRPDTVATVPVRGIGMAIRQTRVGLAVRSSSVLNGSFTGDVDVDFYGGQQPSSGGRTFPLIRMRTARAVVRWTHAHLMIGQESPLVSGVNPESPVAIGTPEFAGAGNLWLWLPQIRGGVESGGRVRFGVDAAVLAPTSGDAVAAFDTDYDLAERSQRPYLQARAHAAWGADVSRGEIGCGVHQGWLMPGASRVTSNAVACDVTAPLAGGVDVRGEFFTGQALRGLGGGGIGQNFDPGSAALSTTGGWAQVNWRPSGLTEMGAGCGTDQPDALAARRRNDACSTYATVRPAGPLFFGAEWRRLRTGYAAAHFTNDHVTLAAGFEF